MTSVVGYLMVQKDEVALYVIWMSFLRPRKTSTQSEAYKTLEIMVSEDPQHLYVLHKLGFVIGCTLECPLTKNPNKELSAA